MKIKSTVLIPHDICVVHSTRTMYHAATTHQTAHSRYLVELAENLNRYLYTEHLIVTTHSRYLVELADNLNRYLYTEHLIVTSACCQLPSGHQSQSRIVGLDFQGLSEGDLVS